MKVKIGEKIKEVLEQRDMKLKNFAEEVGMARQNIYRIFEKDSIDTELLVRISNVLDYDFFTCFQSNCTLASYNSSSDHSNSLEELNRCILELEVKNKEITYLKRIIALMEERTELLLVRNKE